MDDHSRKNFSKSSIWNIGSTILIAVGLVMGFVFITIYTNPHSRFNPFPPSSSPTYIFVPTITSSPRSLPDIWTPNPDIDEETGLYVPYDYDIAPGMEIGPRTIITNTPVMAFSSPEEATGQNEITEVPSPTPFPHPKSATGLEATFIPSNLMEPAPEEEPGNRILSITAPIGVFNNVWQNLQAIPSFSWSTEHPIDEISHYLLYFGPKQNGQLKTRTTKAHYNDSAVDSGIYYFRVAAIAKDGKTIGVPSYFLFKYDDLNPTKPANFSSSSPGDTDIPYFTWTGSMDAHSGMIGGLAGYSIYQGTEKKCGKPVAFTSDTHWTPVTPVEKGTTMYFCIRAMDAIGNESEWVGPIRFTHENN